MKRIVFIMIIDDQALINYLNVIKVGSKDYKHLHKQLLTA